ncbi:MAG: hypothetical protein KA002_00385, partial [Firmicutes bacterium]|nr:hypothetical protein [Bacillota bacterium]
VDTDVWELVDTVAGLSEFRVWLRSFGSSALVIEPECLRIQLVESAMRMRDMYNTGDCDIGDVKRSKGGGLDVDRR